MWAIAALYPFILMVMMEVSKKDSPQNLKVCVVLIALRSLGSNLKVGLYIYFNGWAIVCSLLILYCYIRLYSVTRSSGIWSSRYSRARVTLIAHAVMLLMYFIPGFVYTAELLLFEELHITLQVWLGTVNLSLLMLLPRSFTPYLYGLRYRKIYDTVKLMLCRRCLSGDTLSRQAETS